MPCCFARIAALPCLTHCTAALIALLRLGERRARCSSALRRDSLRAEPKALSISAGRGARSERRPGGHLAVHGTAVGVAGDGVGEGRAAGVRRLERQKEKAEERQGSKSQTDERQGSKHQKQMSNKEAHTKQIRIAFGSTRLLPNRVSFHLFSSLLISSHPFSSLLIPSHPIPSHLTRFLRTTMASPLSSSSSAFLRRTSRCTLQTDPTGSQRS